MRTIKLIGLLALLELVACKTASKVDNSAVKDVLPGNAKYYVAKIDNFSELVFYATDPKTNEIVKPLQKGHSFSIQPSQTELKIDTFPKPLAVNSAVNYGFHTDTPWSCYDAYRLVNEVTVDGRLRKRLKAPKADLGASIEECAIEFDTEDREWYTITISNLGDPSARPSDYVSISMLKNLPVIQHPITAGPMRPGEVNVQVDDNLMTTMLGIEAEFQKTSDNRKERNTCLRNGRAYSWLDIQGHFYCMLPYTPHRKCYSEELVKNTDPLAGILDPKQKVAGLIAAYNASYEKCFTTNPADGTGRIELTPDRAAAFKYVMWTRAGVMDFSIESQNNLINKFYASKPSPEERPRRISDPYPKWTASQKGYDAIRRQQLFSILQSAGRMAEKEIAGAWAKTPLPSQADIDSLMQKSFQDPDNNPYADYRPGAKPANLDLPGDEIIAVMRKGLKKYEDKGARESCLTTAFSPTHWSDIQLHFYCILYNPRECYTYGVSGRSTTSGVRARYETYKECATDQNYGAAGWPWIMDPANDPMPRVFQYVMFSQTHAFKEEQQQELINTLWGLDNPTNPDPADCLKKRPMRSEDRAKDPGRTLGIHCNLNKVIPLDGKGY